MGLFRKLFNNKDSEEKSCSNSDNKEFGLGDDIHIISDRIYCPVKLVGANRTVVLETTELVVLFSMQLLLARTGGWIGGEDFTEIIRGNLVNRRLRKNMRISAEEAKELVRIIYSIYDGDPLQDENQAKILSLFQEGQVVVG